MRKSRAQRKFGEEFVALIEAAGGIDLFENGGETLPDTGNVGDLAVRIRENIGDALGSTYRGGAHYDIADAKSLRRRSP